MQKGTESKPYEKDTMQFLKILLLFHLILLTLVEAKSIKFTQEEQEYIDLNVINVAMIPNLYSLKTLEHNKLKLISHDILQLISKKSALSFSYESQSWISTMNSVAPYNSIPITILNKESLSRYYNNKRSNNNVFLRDKNIDINILNIKEHFTTNKDLINLSHKDIDLFIAPLLDIQIDMIYKNTELLNHIKIDALKKENIQFGIKKNNLTLISIIAKTFDSITKKEWEELNQKWLFDSNVLRIKEKKKHIKHVKKIEKQKSETKTETETEKTYQKYTKENNILNICIQKNLAPISFMEKGKIKGIAIDILQQINNKLNFTLKSHYTKSFAQSLTYIKNKKCDIIFTAGNTFGTSDTIQTSTPIYNFDLAIITKKEIPIVSSLSSILNEKIAIQKNSIFTKQIKEIYPNTPIIETKNDKESFKAITENKAYFTLAPHVIASYYLSKYAINDLYISRYTNIPYTINLAVHKDNNNLHRILNLHLENIPNNIKENILNKWIKAPIKEAFDYSMMTKVLLFILFIITIIIYRQRMLKKYNKKLQIRINEEISKNEFKTKQLIEQSKLAQMGELINMIAHQWRQPLASITAVTNNLLLKQYLDKEISKKDKIEELSSIVDYSQYMSKTIDDFINLYKKDKIKENTTLEDIVETSLGITNSSLLKNNIQINKKFMANTRILTYPSELNQVVLNLLKNSEDAFLTKTIKNPQIIISTYLHQNNIYLEIEDNAGGIQEEYLKKIFEPYFSTKHSKEGSGLGLYMSITIVKDNCKGQLKVKNTKNGVCFTIILPFS